MTRLKVKRTKPKARNQAVVASPRAAGRLAAGLREVIEEWDSDHPEHIERKVFEGISALLNENLIRGAEGKLGLADTLGILFGADSEMKREGEKFERLINGYFGEVDWDDMEEAQNILEEIISELEQLARHDKDSEPKLFSDTHDENK